MLMNAILRFKITDTTGLASARILQETGFIPFRVKAQNVTHVQRPEINKLDYYDAVVSIAGGRQSNYDATTGAETVTSKTEAKGIRLHKGGKRVYYNDPLTPTYQDAAGTAVVAGSIFSASGDDRLAKELPKLTATDTRYISESYKSMSLITSAGIELPDGTENSDMRGDGEVIHIVVER